ncbi:O-acetyltransferase OatA [Legionella massiliensis]|uniref:O-acetyltransferase OatA n=1 Tax=Legionella massiliensis TaxID=1034943 RepID=A0A078L268_9GAMM|nr:acyltransferase family protein [Legionella massiliensis]CDZ78169.1 O-acetyltransferase OatA [Legionella massiliensis]CEE13907.1 O-acetyltransferase OatA [Legionella massiliensis]
MNNTDYKMHSDYRPDIDGLRAIAVLLVVIFHAFPHALKAGFIGVDIFFVISGFLISKIILNSFAQTNRFSLVTFYSRRVNRIFPALILVLVACFSFGWFALLPDEYTQLSKHIMGGAGFIANLLLWNESGYFDNAAVTKPLLHLWSLGIEEQFYIVWPLLVWFAWRMRFSLLFTIVLVFAISFLLNITTVHYDITAAFYSPQTRFWELLTGSFLAFLTVQNEAGLPRLFSKLNQAENKKKLLANIQSMVGIFLIILTLFVLKRGRHFPGWAALLPTIGALLIIGAGAGAWLNRRVLASPIMVWVGLISFPLYLWHWPLLTFPRIITGDLPSVQIRVIAVLMAIFLAWLTYQFIEKPLRANQNKLRSSLALLALMLMIALLGWEGYKTEGFPKRAAMDRLIKANSQFTLNWKYMTNETCLRNYPLKGSEDYAWMFCMANKKEKPTLILLGNSYANHLYVGLAKNKFFKYESILSFGTCDPQWFEKSRLINEPITTSPCSGLRPLIQQRFIDKIIEQSGTVKYAIMSGLRPNVDEEYIKNIKKRIDFLEKNRVKVIVFIPHLTLNYDMKSCFSRPFSGQEQPSCELTLDYYENFLKLFEPFVQSIKKTNPNVVFFNQNQLFCDDKKCSMIRDGLPLFRDQSYHLSEYGSIQLANIFEKWAIENIPEMALNEHKNHLRG